MRSLLLFVFVASVSAFVEIEKDYHESIGIPLATKIKAYEEELAQNPNLNPKIVGGALAPAGAQPYFGGLLIYLLSGHTSVCGSTLISPNRAITAAHCWSYGAQQGRSLTVILNSNQLYSGGTRINTNHVVLHPQWNFNNLNNDVAIIYFPHWVQTSASIQPIGIPSASEAHETFTGHWALATGFGKTQDAHQTASTVLSRVSLQVISHNQCVPSFPPGYIVPSTLCTSGSGLVGICGGDSGGPLVANYNGRQVLIGVSSFVSGNGCQRGFPSGFARVTSFRNFILQNL